MPDKYETYSKEELVRLLRERDRKPKFGLVWERDEIDHDHSVNGDFVALELVTELSCGETPYRNLLIEGDNFDALRYLRMVHAGAVKCVYIDPPFNTGNKDFIYNDHFVDKDDAYKHSKWLEYMYRRLVLARGLLREDGVIFVSIGEEEYAHLSLLMDEVFPGMKVGTFVWKTRAGSQIAKDYYVSKDHEYILCYANAGFSFSGISKSLAGYANPDNDLRGEWVNYNLSKAYTYRERPRSFFPIQNPKNKVWYPCNPDRVWAFSSQNMLKPRQKLKAKTMETIIAEEKVIWPENDRSIVYNSREELDKAIHEGTAPKNLRAELPDLDFWINKEIGYGTPRYKQHQSELKRLEKPLSTWFQSNAEDHDTMDVTSMTTGFTSDGTALLRKMLGENDFSYPKPLSLLSNLIKQSTGPDDVIVDFFAGSGTTAHAVLAVNAEDDGNRRFIIVSSSEATKEKLERNICRDVTKVRLEAAIRGYSYNTKAGKKDIAGLGGGFAYFRTQRIPVEMIITSIQHEQVWTALQLMHAESVSPYQKNSSVQVVQIEGEKSITLMMYLPRVAQVALDAVKKILMDKAEIVIYSWQPALLKQHIHHLGVTFEAIPQFLMDRFGVGTRA